MSVAPRTGKKRIWPWLLLALVVVLLWQVLRGHFADDERRLRSELRSQVEAHYPDAAARIRASFGIRLHPDSDGQASGDVVLVHGLDDPGKVWMNMGPAVAAAGYRTWILDYPNDQPIIESAQLFHDELVRLKAQGVESVTVVAHSMGGLVTREMLTGAATACVDPGGCTRAGVGQLIMIGTPNHGSELARIREFAEFRDQLTKLFDDDFHWLRFIVDGAGEAGLDLLPDSGFLRALNARPAASDTGHVVIAGVLGPIDRQRLDRSLQAPQADADSQSLMMQNLMQTLASLTDRVGDGLVPLSSARLDGVPLCVLTGTHLSIVRNVLEGSERVPPAIPVVLGLLAGKPLRVGEGGCESLQAPAAAVVHQ